jgi:hypothetical protein
VDNKVRGLLDLNSGVEVKNIAAGPVLNPENIAKKEYTKMKANEIRPLEPGEVQGALNGVVYGYGPEGKQGKVVSYLLGFNLSTLGPQRLFEALNAGGIDPTRDGVIRFMSTDSITKYYRKDGQTLKSKVESLNEVGAPSLWEGPFKVKQYPGENGNISVLHSGSVLTERGELMTTTFLNPYFLDQENEGLNAWADAVNYFVGTEILYGYYLLAGKPDSQSSLNSVLEKQITQAKSGPFNDTVKASWKRQ